MTVGSQKFQFNRLLKEIDRLVEENKITEEVFAQIGYSDYRPKNFDYTEFLDRDECSKWMNKCSKVITHGGTGAIIGAINSGKKVIAVPRLAKFGEHVDDHQLQIISKFKEMNLIICVNDINNLYKTIESIDLLEFKKYQSNTKNIIKSIDEYIQF